MDDVLARRMGSELMGSAIAGWTVESVLGFGKSAVVFRASLAGQTAAVKVFDREIVSRFGEEAQHTRVERERRLIGSSHPHLIRILDAGRDADSGLFYVVMDYFDGPNLASMITSTPRDAIRSILRQVASAAKFLEELGLAHRDIKPENIGINTTFSHAVLLDLGVLRPVGALENVTDDGTQKAFVGTLRYSPPELLIREEDDSPEGWRAITFYQLGAVLYDLLERRPLFDGISPWARLVEAVRYKSPSLAAEDVPMDLRLLTGNCLQKDPSFRMSLVSWADFEREGPGPTFDEAAARLAHRRAQRFGSVAPVVSQASPTQVVDRNRRIVETAVQQLLQTGLFPPMELRSSCSAAAFEVHVSFAPSASSELKASLHLHFTGSLRPDGSSNVALHATASLGFPSSIDGGNRATYLLATTDDTDIIESTVKTFAIGALDAGEQASTGNSSIKTEHWLEVEGTWIRLGG